MPHGLPRFCICVSRASLRLPASCQLTTVEERARIAGDWRAAHSIEEPVLLDWPDNRINTEYAGSPQRLYVLDVQGIVTFKSECSPYYHDQLDDWAAALQAVAK